MIIRAIVRAYRNLFNLDVKQNLEVDFKIKMNLYKEGQERTLRDLNNKISVLEFQLTEKKHTISRLKDRLKHREDATHILVDERALKDSLKELTGFSLGLSSSGEVNTYSLDNIIDNIKELIVQEEL